MSELVTKQILIIGLGLIGGSIARGLKKASSEIVISACDTNEIALKNALQEGVIDHAGSLQELCPKADVLVIALPTLTTVELIPEIAALSNANCIVTDVASVKSAVVAAARKQFDSFQQRFVPGHPIAGSEQSGYQASSAELFKDRNVILTPHEHCSCAAVAQINELWRLLHANVLGMELSKHDEILAATSHLPHLLAYAIVDALADQQQSENIFRYAAGGFADFSRLASSNAKMWSDIFIANADATVAVLDKYIDRLQVFRERITNAEHDTLVENFSNAKIVRDEFIGKYFGGKVSHNDSKSIINYLVEPGSKISGSIRVPGDKSISHRAIILGSIAEGTTKVSGFLEGEDALNTLKAFQEMGVTIIGPDNGELTIYGVGIDGLKAPRVPLNMGNSGTAMRLMAGLLAAQQFDSELLGDESLNQRPMARVIDPLTEMGAEIASVDNGKPPLKISGRTLKGIEYSMKIASAQVKSCLLLAGLYAEGDTSVSEPASCRDHTERMLKGFGYSLAQDESTRTTKISGGGTLQGTSIDVPADISSAAFFLVAATITPGATLCLEHVGINPTRNGIINLLRAMGAEIELSNKRKIGGEPVADLLVSYSQLKGITVPENQIPLAIDEFPVFFVAAACAEGVTELRGAEELRVKESDRIEAMAIGLRTLGVEVETFVDGIRIQGGPIGGGRVESFGDHRIAMAFVIAGLRASAPIEINDCANVATSFPGFISTAQQAGIKVSERECGADE
ncbi:MAG: bifunctional prephenate dehydrogenase/3-phosphoshikimate 1-carboxyvinyltransferase [Pseudomonadales bacterium]|nr:bifunctional prephenate dehydrogenase/3-phosphoshikimate 1-carboxyvinyltransferase [Pseudomonadales bacterium]